MEDNELTEEITDDGIVSDHGFVTMEDYTDIHGEPVHEGEDRVVFSDEHGHELREWADVLGMDRSDLSERMHEMGREVYGSDESDGTGDPWSVDDPVVFNADKFEE